MRICGKLESWLLCATVFSVVAAQIVDAQPPLPTGNAPTKVGAEAVGDILKRLGAKLERGTSAKKLDEYGNHFDRTDPNRDGKHTKREYVDNGGYMTPQARAGIFRAADGNADGIVTRAEYVLNRIITDEAKSIVQEMDDDKDGLVERAEFVKHAAKLFADPKLAENVYSEFDANADGSVTIPEYLRVWGQWARAGRKPAEERIAARRSELAKDKSEPDTKPAQPGKVRLGGGPPYGRPGFGAGPPNAKAIFSRFDRDRNGKLAENEVPAPLWNRLSNMDADSDGIVTFEEFGKSRNRRPSADPTMNERSGEQAPSAGPKGIKPAPANCPACAMGLTAEFVFKRLDVNKDRKIVVVEFEKSPGMRSEAQAREAVTKIDTNGDGVLTWEEFEEAYRIRHAGCKKTPPTGKDGGTPITGPGGKGDGNRFAQVFMLRSDRNGDGRIDRKEFRGSDTGFDRLDKNGNGFIEPDELNELHQQRLADPKTMRQRLQEGDTRRPSKGNQRPTDSSSGR